MNRDIKSFFLLSASAFVSLFILSSWFAYSFFELSRRLSFDEKSQLLLGWVVIFGFILLLLYLMAKKFLYPLLEISTLVNAYKQGQEHHADFDYFNDETSLISEHLNALHKELDEDNNTLESLSLTDSLTGVHNRRYFVECGEQIFKLSKRNKEPLSLIMFDIDHLGSLNTKYGKESGDKVLSILSEVVEEHIRKSDIFARYAKDIFVILLPQTDETNLQNVVHKIESTFNTAEFKNKADAYFSISMGSASLQESDILLRNLTQRADESLKQVKKSRPA